MSFWQRRAAAIPPLPESVWRMSPPNWKKKSIARLPSRAAAPWLGDTIATHIHIIANVQLNRHSTPTQFVVLLVLTNSSS
eukprot:gene11783-biopygen5339